MEKIRVAVIGTGGRGKFWLKQLLQMEDVEVTAICDKHPERVEENQKHIFDAYGHEVFASTDYRDVVVRDDIDAVIVSTYWNDHVKIAVAAMKNGKYAGFEVGSGQSIYQCWELVRTSEETGMPCMLLENCCYGKAEMTVLNMVKKGLFGEIVHCEGGYYHDKRDIITTMERDHERAWQHWHRNGDVYPTHELGPIMNYLNINRGNRFMTLTSMACKQRGMINSVREKFPPESEHQNEEYHLGDVITTCLKCANGETAVIQLKNGIPRPYSRGSVVEGTNGIYMEDKKSVYVHGRTAPGEWEPLDNYMEEYEHPLWKKSTASEYSAGHGGMDWLVARAFLEAVRNRTQTPLDVYDSATMLAVSVLSEESVALGSAPLAIPDFTDGRWIKRDPDPKSIYSLFEVNDDLFEGEVRF